MILFSYYCQSKECLYLRFLASIEIERNRDDMSCVIPVFMWRKTEGTYK